MTVNQIIAIAYVCAAVLIETGLIALAGFAGSQMGVAAFFASIVLFCGFLALMFVLSHPDNR